MEFRNTNSREIRFSIFKSVTLALFTLFLNPENTRGDVYENKTKIELIKRNFETNTIDEKMQNFEDSLEKSYDDVRAQLFLLNKFFLFLETQINLNSENKEIYFKKIQKKLHPFLIFAIDSYQKTNKSFNDRKLSELLPWIEKTKKVFEILVFEKKNLETLSHLNNILLARLSANIAYVFFNNLNFAEKEINLENILKVKENLDLKLLKGVFSKMG